MKNKLTNNPLAPVINILVRYNLVIFIVLVVVGLIAAILMLNFTLRTPFEANNFTSSNSGITSFDEATINRLNKLKTSDENLANQTLPTGRVNPFSE
jgi:hypothetical protein